LKSNIRKSNMADSSSKEATPMDAVFVLTVTMLAFGGLAAALAWAEMQNRAPGR
jgi:hypothetical protein